VSAVFSKGSEEQLQLIREQLIVGQNVGKVPSEVPSVPLQNDIEKQIKTARLSKYWHNTDTLWLKGTKANPRGGIDLREEKDLLKSHLLHRLNMLDIPWGRQEEVSRFDTGSFKELWKMKWRPDFAIRIIEAGMWGTTLYEAASNFVFKQIDTTDKLSKLAEMTGQALNAGLNDVIDPLINRLRDVAALTKDVYFLLDSLPPLVNIIRYGDARKTDVSAVKKLSEELIERICIGLPGACINIDEDAATLLLKKIQIAGRAVSILNNKKLIDQWYISLRLIVESPFSQKLIKGSCTRTLFDKNIIKKAECARLMQYALSPGNTPQAVANWIEGFLDGSGLLLIHHPELWLIIDRWIDALKMDPFYQVLPLLRRTFAHFSSSEKEKMMQLAKGEVPFFLAEEQQKEWNETRGEAVREMLGLLLSDGV